MNGIEAVRPDDDSTCGHRGVVGVRAVQVRSRECGDDHRVTDAKLFDALSDSVDGAGALAAEAGVWQVDGSRICARPHHLVESIEADGFHLDPHFTRGGFDDRFVDDLQDVRVAGLIENDNLRRTRLS